MPKTLVLVGLPGSGKSTLAREMQKIFGAASAIISPSQVESEHPEWAGNNPLIFSCLHFRLGQTLDQQRTAIYDATNAVPEHRRQILEVTREHQASAIAVWLDTPVKLCLERAFNRPPDIRQVNLTPEVIERMAEVIRRFPPSHNEGFDHVFRVAPNEPFPFDQL
jgi:predicted kinase